jgi:hypothetical protein
VEGSGIGLFLIGRVSDPHRFNAYPDTDPDLAFFLIADRDSGSGSQATGEAFSPQKRTSSTVKHENSGLFYFCGSFLPSWIRIRIRNLNADPDPDPATQINADPDTDPDPKPC